MAWLTNAKLAERVDPLFQARGESITYIQKADATNYQTGVITENDTPTTIGSGTRADPGVLVGELSQDFINQSGGKYKFGDREFKIRNADMPETPPKKANEIVYNGDTYVIREHLRSQDGNIWAILTNKL